MTKSEIAAVQANIVANHTANGWTYGYNSQAKIIVLTRKVDDKFESKTIIGRSCKIYKYYAHSTFEVMEKYISNLVSNLLTKEEEKIQRRELTKKSDARDHWSEGDVVSYSWGYDQTNVDWFQVIKVTKGQIQLKEIHENSSDHGQPGGGKCQPCRNEFKSEEIIRKRFDGKYPDSLSFPHGCGTKWDGKAKYCSSDR